MSLIPLDDLRSRDFVIQVFEGADPMFINEETYYEIGCIGKRLEDGYAYVIGDYCYPFRGKEDISEERKIKVGIYENTNRKYYVKMPSSSKDKALFSIEHITSLSIDDMWEQLKNNKDDFITDIDREMINSNKKKYIPTIRTNDDTLQKIVKYAIIGKNTNINIFQNIFDKEHGLTNLKTTLKPDATMTMKRFVQWADILNLGYRIIVFDNGHDLYYPLPYEIHYNSMNDEVMLFDDKGRQVDTEGKPVIIETEEE